MFGRPPGRVEVGAPGRRAARTAANATPPRTRATAASLRRGRGGGGGGSGDAARAGEGAGPCRTIGSGRPRGGPSLTGSAPIAGEAKRPHGKDKGLTRTTKRTK